jgi:hypothetical protein
MYPWRPLDNLERRARWECAYRAQAPLERRKWMRGRIGQRYREEEGK